MQWFWAELVCQVVSLCHSYRRAVVEASFFFLQLSCHEERSYNWWLMQLLNLTNVENRRLMKHHDSWSTMTRTSQFYGWRWQVVSLAKERSEISISIDMIDLKHLCQSRPLEISSSHLISGWRVSVVISEIHKSYMIRLQGGNHLPVGTRRCFINTSGSHPQDTPPRPFEAAQVVRGAFTDGTRVWIGVGFGRQEHDLVQGPCTYSCGSPWFIRGKCGNGTWGTWSWFTYDWVGFLQQRWQVA